MRQTFEDKQTFIEHLRELRRLLFLPAGVLVIVMFAALAKGEVIIAVLQKPLAQTLYYNHPLGGFSFVVQAALFCGLLASIPFFVYSFIKFLAPVMKRVTKRTLLIYVSSSVGLAIVGVLCGYFGGLPVALHFFTKFDSKNLQPLISASEYLSFVMTYLAGFALLFQLPLIIIIINRIKPLKPGKLMHYQRYVIGASIIISAFLTPTPNLLNQLIYAAPMIVLYQISIGLVWLINRNGGDRKTIVAETPVGDPLPFPHPVGQIYYPQLVPVESPIQLDEQQPVYTMDLVIPRS